MRTAAVVILLVLPAFSGCAFFQDLVEDATRPNIPVARTSYNPDGWNTDARFQVIVQQEQAAAVRILAAETTTGHTLETEGHGNQDNPVMLRLDDGTWDITYWVADHRWETLAGIRIDATPPQVTGLELIGDARHGSYVLGADAQVEAGARVRVIDMQSNRVVATSLPVTLTGLHENRVYGFLVAFGDTAGNWNNRTVQVRAGEAAALPTQGSYTFGIVARYTNSIRLWDLTDLDAYATLAEARHATDPGHLGTGYGITPDDPQIQAIVDGVVEPGMHTTAEVAFALYRWLFDNLEYHDERLSETDLLQPRETLQRGGGVCRDLAALYVSLLRAADVPARLVSGYLAGSVDGFHAWVEFYGGPVKGQDPWVPVDVSPIEGSYSAPKALGAFGIQRPDYLTLRVVAPEAEVEGWSTALSVRYKYYGQEPKVSFQKQVALSAREQTGVLCVDPGTLNRALGNTKEDCDPTTHSQYVADFVHFTERIIDYGVLLERYRAGDEFTTAVAFPHHNDILPNEVSFIVYGRDGVVENWRLDATSGQYAAAFTV